MPMPAYLSAEGTKQGKIEGSCDQQGREGTMLVQAFSHEVTLPRAADTGLPAGQRRHMPFTIVKYYDKASPKLYASLTTGEHFTDVTLKWFRITPEGTEEHYFTHKLEDAIIVSIRPWMPNCLDESTRGYGHMEEVAFTYRKITWTWEPDGIIAEDDWMVRK